MYALSKLTILWLCFAVVAVAVASYFVALMIDGVLGDDGFGTLGNMAVLTIGFFGGIILYEYLGYYLKDFQIATFVGVGGALLTIMILALFKLIVDKIMH